jgi:hypothetical protein
MDAVGTRTLELSQRARQHARRHHFVVVPLVVAGWIGWLLFRLKAAWGGFGMRHFNVSRLSVLMFLLPMLLSLVTVAQLVSDIRDLSDELSDDLPGRWHRVRGYMARDHGLFWNVVAVGVLFLLLIGGLGVTFVMFRF